MLTDRFHRKIEYLRISVTDKCNLRCRYCMPEEGVDIKSHEQLLRWEEIYRMVQAFTKEGISKVRITGGEPLVRKGLLNFIERLNNIGLQDISITSNGILLSRMAADLKQAGINRINISLDSLNKERYAWITRGGDVNKVLKGIEAAFQAGLEPVKLNTVVVRGFNHDEVVDLALLSKDMPLHVRFIELMPVGTDSIWGKDSFVSTAETIDRLREVGELKPARVNGNGPAQVWQLPGCQGTVGFISAISNHFCAKCNRIRLTADGRIYPCLHSDNYLSCFESLRNGTDDEELKTIVHRAVALKPGHHHLGVQERMMNAIGG
ncbi:MAG: GTP 3',8-cyclase MoaA [Desulfitobacteriaceae bacterium]|nr:GTP 3',8-cyclase MoaA [Desulfitobacteriaceae bacterium]